MIDPKEIVLAALPSLPLEQSSELPQIPGIYIAYIADSSTNTIQYIGRSTNIYRRWRTHHRFNDLIKVRNIRIAWIVIEDTSLLPGIESVLIRFFNPPLNGAIFNAFTGEITKTRNNRAMAFTETNWNETKSERTTIALTATGKRELDRQCEEKNISRSELIERYLRGTVSVPPLAEESREQLFSPATPIRLTVDQIIEVLDSLRFQDLARVAQFSVGSIVQRKILEEEPKGREELAIAFLKKLVNQEKPSNTEINTLAELMDEDSEEIAALVASI